MSYEGTYGNEIRPANHDYLPLRWSEVFGNENPIIVEIGFGGGEYLENCARSHPEKNFVGFEVSVTSMKKATNRVRWSKQCEVGHYRCTIRNARVFGPKNVGESGHEFSNSLGQTFSRKKVESSSRVFQHVSECTL